MSRSAGPRFFKLSAGGNDFIVLPSLDGERSDWTAAKARAVCARRLSLGADGCIVLHASSRAIARFELWNSDGSEAAFSGNGARCASRVLSLLGLDEDGALSLETSAGIVAARVRGVGESVEVEIDMDAPVDLRPGLALPSGSPGESGDYAVLGVPCLAVPVTGLDALDLPRVGPPLRHWDALADGANVSFYEPGEDGPQRLRIWERGVEGETLSSGTGCAIVAVSRVLRSGLVADDGDHRIELMPPSGISASVTASCRGGSIVGLRLAGDARLVAQGELGPDSLSGS